jgi:anti-sigma factor RsiW
MIHYKHQDWLAYIKDELTENKCEEVENHLFSCDDCLDIYMNLVNEETKNLPDLKDEKGFTDGIINSLSSKQEKPAITRKRPVYQQPLFHYGVAAAVTFVLMTSGFFQSITGFVSTVEAASTIQSENSVSDNLMKKAISLIELIQPNQKEGE